MKKPAIAMYQPDIPQNVGAMMRLAACTGVELHIIEPCGFPWDERKIRQSGMDYVDNMDYTRHESWAKFRENTAGRRLVLLTTKGAEPYYNFEFQDGDIILAGRESAGVPDEVHNAAHARLLIPMAGSARSLNVVNATSMVLGEALRQANGG
ncbi:MAG TPA: tRNA (cytidine(34)-2'-O)-methyltransferase [Alphaproteobacteria bacterium]|nr:tRNA (cytidine(34)-2'-O)-methyltransferase [Micavibrio sp.]MBK9561599.1 tRNA (cytidine(34)-2'-O)-methyltransferase [Micavibrio sp.]HQX27424.1 tRNA (cytidine(34)-2'-O)-methyltransferase [Alphaproteobacteria bacterium]